MSKIRLINNNPDILGEYDNGNYHVTIYRDGTKVRETFDENATEFIANKPECMDVKITNQCDIGCLMCHEDSTKNGKHGEIMTPKFWETLNPYTEIAIGGGNPLSHPDLVNFLLKAQKLKLIPNITVNQTHFMKDLEFIKFLVDKKLIYGLGISLVEVTDSFIESVKMFPNAVIHIINGMVTMEELEQLSNHDLKVLILGYKEFRRGEKYFETNYDKVVERKGMLYEYLPKMLKNFKVVSFDNLALDQLEVRRLLSEDEWNEFYMGTDGSFTMYIDLVSENYAVSSIAVSRFDLEDSIDTMFNRIKSLNKN